MDFCTEGLSTSVSASQVSTDGYEVQNLISTDIRRKNKGFLAESFIKPPVDILFEFTCNVNISHIVLKPTVGGQRSTGFDLASFVERSTGRGLRSKENSESDPPPPQYDEFLIAKGFFEKETQIYFVNQQFRTKNQIVDTLDRSSIPSTHRELRNQCPNALRYARKIRIRVWRTSHGNVPALGAVQIFGIPAHGSDPSIIERFRTFQRRVRRSPTDRETDSPPPFSPRNPSLNTSSLLLSDIPQEFSDPITCEIMILPILLPSGNTIDQSTLDKHVATEASWGRPPNDPFTGMPFSSEHKPVTNSLLKSRIDQFLIHNEHLANGRTTGTKKRVHDSEKKTLIKEPDIETEPSSKRKSQPVVLLSEPHPGTSRSVVQSLDEVLKNTLKSMTSYTTNGESSSSPKDVSGNSKWARVFLNPNGCSNCNDVVEHLYRLPCSHITCKKCITSELKMDTKRKCPLCQAHFTNNQVVRTHNNQITNMF